MTFRQFIYAVELADAGSFRRAAENLNISHAALVHSIRALEEHYGVRLFDRGRGVKALPTEIGEIFLKCVREIIQSEKKMILDLRLALEPGSGFLNIIFGPYPNIISGREAVSRIISRYPNLQIKMSIRQYKQAMHLILERKADIAIAEQSYQNQYPELEMESLGAHLAGFFCRPDHPLLEKRNLTIEEIVAFPWCSTRLPARIRDYLPPDLHRAGSYDALTFEVVPAIEIEALSGLKSLIKNSDVLGLASLVTLKEELVNGDLALLPFHDVWMVTNYGFISLQNSKATTALEEFKNEIRRVEKKQFLEEQQLAENYLWRCIKKPCAESGQATVTVPRQISI